MRPPDILVTQRLEVRAPLVGDAEAIFADYAQDPDVTRYVVWTPHKNAEETRAFLDHCVQAWQGESEFHYVMLRKSDRRLLGMMSMLLQKHRAELGYVVAKEHWNQGYATEGVRAMIHWALSQPWIHRVSALCDCDNPASARVMEKAGMAREGVLRRLTLHPNVSPVPRDCLSYSIVRDDSR